MRSSSRERPGDRPGRLGVGALLVAALVATGCAASGRRAGPPEEPPGHPTATPPPAASPPAATGVVPAPASPARTTPPAGRLDPSEEITPEELAAIPDPVAATAGASSPGTAPGAASGANPGLKGSSGAPMDSVPPTAPETPSTASGATSAQSGAGWAWRVQVFASDRPDEAERVAREAEARLGVRASVEREGPLFKVRLGRFGSESEAQALRARAAGAGYTGAFRVKTR